MIRPATLAFVLAAAAACSSGSAADADDPIAALSSSEPSSRYTVAYWRGIRTSQDPADAAVWSRALEACAGDPASVTAARPNCAPVLSEDAMHRAVGDLLSRPATQSPGFDGSR